MSEPKIQTLVGIPPKERARLQDIEAKAIALLRCHYGLDESCPTMNGCCQRLLDAIGITVEELRGEQ